jgi:LPS-assembly protein
VEGQRVVMNPTFTAPIAAPGYFITPKVGLHYVSYNLQNAGVGIPDRQSVAIPWYSLDSGLVFERNMKFAGASYAQTLEPRLYYVHIPYRDQSRIPVFDTGLSDFNYANIFTENRFSGNDRFGDANQLTAAVTTRLLGTSGQELLRATIAQRFYFRDESVGLTPASELRTYGSSDILASLGGKVSKDWSFDTGYEYNARLARTERLNAAMRYAPELAKVVNLGYRFTRDALNQIDLSGQWPLRPGLYGVGRYNYSFKDGRLLEGIAGLEYNAGCWILRVVGQRLQTATQLATTSFFVQLELGEMMRVGTDPGDVLRRSVPSYTSTHLRPDQPVPLNLQPKLPFDLVY